MLDLPIFISLMDQVVKLLDYGNKRDRAFFEKIITPCFTAAEVVRNDIIAICGNTEIAITNGVPPESLNKKLISARRTTLASRDFLRIALQKSETEFTEFESGIEELLTGSGTHAIMDMHRHVHILGMQIKNINTTSQDADNKIALIRGRQIAAVNQLRDNTEVIWRKIVTGYLNYTNKFVARPA